MAEPMKNDDEPINGEMVEFEEDEPDVEDTEDGGAIVRFGDEKQEKERLSHFANIVDEVDQSALSDMVVDLMNKIERDKEAREKRDKQYEEGLRRTGLGDDAPGGAQFAGANKVVHPMLVEACVDFSARVMKEVFPPAGPVKSKIYGESDKEKLDKAARKAEFMNWQCTEQMPEFRAELAQLSTQLPLGGGQYMKFVWDPRRRRPMPEFVPIDDVYLPFAATNFYTAERRTHVQYITDMEYRRRVKAGMYIDVDLSYAPEIEQSSAAKANDKIEGRKDTSYNEDGLRTVFEISTWLDFGDGLEPYLITIDKSSQKALCLYRNWEPDDDMKLELDWMVEFGFVPWRGAYPIGLTHMIGGLSGAATGALRALLDSAHIQNVPTLLKLKGGPNGQTINVRPTEVAEIEGGALVDDIRKLVMAVPFNGPSPTLFQLLGFLVDAGKGVVQTSFEKLADQNPAAPVGTTMALIEQGMVVFNSIHSRMHESMARCFKIIHRINSAYLTKEDIERQCPEMEINPEDFDGPIDVVPVSDPAIFSETQRFAQVQAIMQRADARPDLYDPRKVEELFLRTLKVPDDEVLKPVPANEDRDPVSENVAAAMGQPVFVLPKQDHLAHIMTHMAFLKSPLFGANPAIVKTYLFPMAQHLRDHILNYYLKESHDAVDKAQRGKMIQDDAKDQVNVILQVQRFIEQQLGNFSQELAQIDQAAQQFAPQQGPQDPTMQVANMNAQTQKEIAGMRAQADQQKAAQQAQLDQQKLAQDAEFKRAKLAQDAQVAQLKVTESQQERDARLAAEQMKQEQENMRTFEDIAAKERMNTADNDTAKLLAAAEMATGERVAVSTGTGINPNP